MTGLLQKAAARAQAEEEDNNFDLAVLQVNQTLTICKTVLALPRPENCAHQTGARRHTFNLPNSWW